MKIRCFVVILLAFILSSCVRNNEMPPRDIHKQQPNSAAYKDPYAAPTPYQQNYDVDQYYVPPTNLRHEEEISE